MNRKKVKTGQSLKQRQPLFKVTRSEGGVRIEAPNSLPVTLVDNTQNTDYRYDWILYAIVLVLLLLTLLMAGVVLAPKSRLMFEKRSAGVHAEKSSQSESNSEFVEEFEHSGVPCDKLMESARQIIDNRLQSEWEGALDLLATCALQEKDNAAPRWNLAVALLKMDRVEEALGFMDEAMSIDPTNLEFLKTGGAYLSKWGYHTEVIRVLEYYLEVSLHVPSWEGLLATISVQREDEWQFLYNAGKDIVQVLEMLQASYLKGTSLIKAGYLYKVLIGLKGESVELELLGAYSSFAFGLGDVATGIKYLRLYTEKQYVTQGYGDLDQAYEVVTAHSLRLLTAGFDSTINSIVKNLLNGGQPVWEELVYNCDMQESNMLNFSVRVRQIDVRRILIKCIQVQGVIEQIVDDGAVLYAENIFGWTPLLHATALGSPDVIKKILAIDPDPQSRTVLAQTALHVAAIKGAYSTIEPLLRAGLKATDKDYFNRTALQVSCLQRWTSKGIARALGQTLPKDCPKKLLYSNPPKLPPQGGWLGSGISLPKSLTKEKCDIDVLAAADVETFVFDYLSLQRPVLIRNVTSNQQMKALYQRWQRNKFEHEFRALKFTEVEVPYAESLGYKTSKQTTIKKFLAKMRVLNQEQKELSNIADFSSPTYIYETIPLNSPIISDFTLPSILDPETTNIDIHRVQFYLGPTLSGSPVHFHRNAWNILVYGQKRWFLYPPEKAFYSKQHVLNWWKENHTDDRGWSETPPLECVQYPGDLMFIPDMWGHGVINLKESIGLASEFVYGASEFSI